MSFKNLKFEITGESPLLPHNGQTCDPLNEYSRMLKKVSSKRQKTEEDHMEMSRIEWYAGLYLKDKKPCIPGFVVEACLTEAAKKSRRGKQALSGLIVPDDALIKYDGAKNIDELFKDEKFRLRAKVTVNQSGVMRTRPKFDEWSATIVVQYDPLIFNESDVVDIVKTSGDVGLCDWRPKFGRFSVKKL